MARAGLPTSCGPSVLGRGGPRFGHASLLASRNPVPAPRFLGEAPGLRLASLSPASSDLTAGSQGAGCVFSKGRPPQPWLLCFSFAAVTPRGGLLLNGAVRAPERGRLHSERSPRVQRGLRRSLTDPSRPFPLASHPAPASHRRPRREKGARPPPAGGAGVPTTRTRTRTRPHTPGVEPGRFGTLVTTGPGPLSGCAGLLLITGAEVGVPTAARGAVHGRQGPGSGGHSLRVSWGVCLQSEGCVVGVLAYRGGICGVVGVQAGAKGRSRAKNRPPAPKALSLRPRSEG